MAEQIKPLPRDESGEFKREFTANGKKYIIRGVDEPLGILRFSQMQKFGGILGYNASFQAVLDNVNKYDELVLADEPFHTIKKKIVLHTKAIVDGFLTVNADRYEKAFYLATLFICEEGEDLSNWSKSHADQKISDWNKEGLNEVDFLSLALVRIAGFVSAYQRRNKELKEMEEARQTH